MSKAGTVADVAAIVCQVLPRLVVNTPLSAVERFSSRSLYDSRLERCSNKPDRERKLGDTAVVSSCLIFNTPHTAGYGFCEALAITSCGSCISNDMAPLGHRRQMTTNM